MLGADLGDAMQNLIADDMTMFVVNLFEVVEIKQQERCVTVGSVSSLDLPGRKL